MQQSLRGAGQEFAFWSGAHYRTILGRYDRRLPFSVASSAGALSTTRGPVRRPESKGPMPNTWRRSLHRQGLQAHPGGYAASSLCEAESAGIRSVTGLRPREIPEPCRRERVADGRRRPGAKWRGRDLESVRHERERHIVGREGCAVGHGSRPEVERVGDRPRSTHRSAAGSSSERRGHANQLGWVRRIKNQPTGPRNAVEERGPREPLPPVTRRGASEGGRQGGHAARDAQYKRRGR